MKIAKIEYMTLGRRSKAMKTAKVECMTDSARSRLAFDNIVR